MKCEKCGSEIKPEDIFCPNCGELLVKEINIDDVSIDLYNLVYDTLSNNFGDEEKTLELLRKDNQYTESQILSAIELVNISIDNICNNIMGIEKTYIINENNETLSSKLARAYLMNKFFGTVGVIATLHHKPKRETTFKIIYCTGETDIITVNNDSADFKEYCRYL